MNVNRSKEKAQILNPNQTIGTLLAFDKMDVADPYYGNVDDFQKMFAHIEKVVDVWMEGWQVNQCFNS